MCIYIYLLPAYKIILVFKHISCTKYVEFNLCIHTYNGLHDELSRCISSIHFQNIVSASPKKDSQCNLSVTP